MKRLLHRRRDGVARECAAVYDLKRMDYTTGTATSFEVIPAEFVNGLNDIAAGRTVAFEITLIEDPNENQAPPPGSAPPAG